MWGTTAIAYDPAAVGAKLDDSWKEMFEPRPAVAGRIAMLADMGEVFKAAAMYLGYDDCTASPQEGQKILELLQAQKPAVKLYSSSGSIDRIRRGGDAPDVQRRLPPRPGEEAWPGLHLSA